MKTEEEESAAAFSPRLEETPVLLVSDISDDRMSITPGDKVILIIEDDVRFIPLLMELGRERGFKCVVAPRGDKGLNLGTRTWPAAITLDIRLPDMAGWLVLSRLKYDPATRHIPVHVISVDEDYRRGLAFGADSYLEKTQNADALHARLSIGSRTRCGILPTCCSWWTATSRRRRRTTELIGDNGGVLTTAVATGEEALRQAQMTEFDCAVITPPDRRHGGSGACEKNSRNRLGGLSFQPSYTRPGVWIAKRKIEFRRVAETAVDENCSYKGTAARRDGCIPEQQGRGSNRTSKKQSLKKLGIRMRY